MTAEVWAPACIDAEELAGWEAMNRSITALSARATSPCSDCLREFSDEMRALGRCNGIPKGDRREDEDMDVVKLPANRIEVAVVAPCEACLHREVCGLREKVEAIDTAALDAPYLVPALSLKVVATVACLHFAKERGKTNGTGAPTRSHHFTPEGLARIQEANRVAAERRRAAKAAATA